MGENKLIDWDIMHFEERFIPFKNLGVPIVSFKLSSNDYKPLIGKILARIKS